MVTLFDSGRIVDIVLGITVLEALALVAYRSRTGRGPAAGELIGCLLPGVCLMLALRAALVDAWWGCVAIWLAAAFAAHLSDLQRRWPPRGT